MFNRRRFNTLTFNRVTITIIPPFPNEPIILENTNITYLDVLLQLEFVEKAMAKLGYTEYELSVVYEEREKVTIYNKSFKPNLTFREIPDCNNSYIESIVKLSYTNE